jgi:ADP-dependent NAD(P)H-hydrate dehydratase / NAD(P)H-hydrate epimerase
MIPLFSTDQVREVDSYAINVLGIPGLVLMENAALQIFSIVIGKISNQNKIDKIGFVCGKGNNGGDGFAAARHFANNNFKVNVVYIGSENQMSPDCLSNYKVLSNLARQNENIVIKKYGSGKDLRFIADSQIIFDALLGSGAHGALREPYKSIIENINKIRSYKVAVDIPTGLDADKGSGETTFNADLTVTLGEYKRGLFYSDGAVYTGEVVKGNIGVSYSFFDRFDAKEYLIEPEDAFNFLPVKNKDVHKYSAGKVFILAGSEKLPGAAVLTSSSTLKIGAGSSILGFPNSARKLVNKKLLEVIVESYEDKSSGILSKTNLKELNKRLTWCDVLAIGPGLGRDEETQETVLEIIKTRKNKKIVIDADAIYALRNKSYLELNLKNAVLTPHQGEFANLIGVEPSELKKDILLHGKQFVEQTGAYLVLKGSPTIIFTPEGDALINTSGNPGMAKFGTGDVLTGVLAGLIAQSKNIEKAVIAGVYIHSLAADLLLNNYTEYSYTANDIIKNLPKAIKFLRKTFM